MDFFELRAAMRAKAPVVTRIIQPTYTTAVVGRVVGISHRMDQNDEEVEQVEILQRGTNSVVVVTADKVEKLWEGAVISG